MCLTLIWGKLSVIIVSNISSDPFFFLLLVLSFYVYYTFCNLFYNLRIFCSFFYCFQFLFTLLLVFDSSIDRSSSSEKFFSCVDFTKKPIKGMLHFCYSVFFFPLAFHFDSFLGFPLLCLHCSSVLTCCLLSLRPFSILVIIVLKSSVIVSASCYVWF